MSQVTNSITKRFESQTRSFDKSSGTFTANAMRRETKGGNISMRLDTQSIDNYFNNRRADVNKRLTAKQIAVNATKAANLKTFLKGLYPTADDATINAKAAIFQRGLKVSGLLAKDSPSLKHVEVFTIIQSAAKAIVATAQPAPIKVGKKADVPAKMTGKAATTQTVAVHASN